MNAFGRPGRHTRTADEHNRVTWVAAVIFFLLAAMLGRLAYLQVGRHTFYAAAADGQHRMYQELIPERGKIFIQDSRAAGDSLYPIAVTKEFASVFAIPKDIADVQPSAEKLYEFFRKKKVEAEVEAALKLQREDRLAKQLATVEGLSEAERPAREAAIRADHEALIKDPVYLDFENQKREEMIKASQEKIIADFVTMLSKPDDEYEPIEKKVEDQTLRDFYIYMTGRTDIGPADLSFKGGKAYLGAEGEELVLKGFGYEMVPFRYYPEKNIGAHILGFAGYEDEEQRGKYGLEGFFDEELFGHYGSVSSERGAGGTVIVNDRQYTKKTDGSSLVLTIDRSAQFTACKMLEESVARHGAEGGSVIVVDSKTGAILAMCSAPDFDPNNYRSVPDIKVFNNPAVFAQYEPGSVFKAITMAAALDQEKVTPDTTYQDHGQIMIPGWPKPIKNSDFATHGGHGTVDMVTVLEQSLNTGAIFAMQQVGVRTFADYVKKFGFGEKTGIELEGESEGNIRSITERNVKEISAATASFGQGITVTPLQMVMSYAAIANGGLLMKPYIVQEVISPDGHRTVTPPSEPRRVISERTSTLLTGMLTNVVENGHSQKIQIPGYYIAGKTGTAQVASATSRGYSGKYNHTFIGIVPATSSRFVILTKIDSPRTYMYAEGTAVPLAHDITKFLLNHWQVKQERPLEETAKR